MESKAVIIQEPVSTKIHVKEDLERVVLDHTSMEVDKRLLSNTFLDDDTKSRNRKTDILPKDVKIVNDSGNQESEDEKDELEGLNTKKEDEKVISSDVVLKKEKEEEEEEEEVSVEKPVKEEDQTEAEQEEEIPKVSQVLAYEEKPIKNDEVKDSRNSENIVNETTIEEEETATNGESKHDTETSKRGLLEADKEVERKIDAEPSLNPIKEVETETLNKVIEDSKIVNNEETTVNEPVEAIKNSGDAEKISNEVAADIEKKEVQESPNVIETQKLQGEDIESKASLKPKEYLDQSSKAVERQEHVLVKDIGETEKVHSVISGEEEEGQETKEDAENSVGLKEDTETEETEKVKTESHGRQESVELKEKVEDDITEEEKHESLLHVQSTETDKYRDNNPEIVLLANREIPETYEEVDVTQTMEEHRGLDSSEPEAEQIGQNRTDETEKNIAEKLVALPDEHMEKLSLESPSQVSEETSKTVDEKIEEVTLQQGGQVSLPNVQEKEKMLLQEQTDKHAPTSEQVIKGETVVEAEKIEQVKASGEEEEDKIKKSLEEDKEHKTVSEKTTEEKAIEEEPMVQTKSQERQDDISKAVETGETKVVQEEQPREIVTSLNENCNVDQPHSDEQVKEASSKNDAKEETATNGESLHDSDTTKRALEAEKQEEKENQEMKTEDIIVSLPDVESVAHMEKPSLESPSQVSGETSNTVDEKIEQVTLPSPSKELEGETVVEDIKENEEEQEEEEDKFKKNIEIVVEPHSSSPSSLEEKEHESVSEKIEVEKAIEDTTKGQETKETVLVDESIEVKSKETVQDDITKEEKHENLLDVQSTETEKHQDNIADIAQSTEEHRGQDLDDPKADQNRTNETEEILVKKVVVLLHDVEPSLESPSLVSEETNKPAEEKIEDIEVNKEEKIKKSLETVEEKEHVETDETTVVQEDQTREISSLQESESFKVDDDHYEDKEKKEDITQKPQEMQESPRVLETPILQEEETESKASIELKEDVDQISKATEEHVLERDITDCETLETETIDTSTLQETKEDKETSLNLKEDKDQKEEETVKSVILTNEVRSSYQDDVQEHEVGEKTEPRSSEIKDESHGREESIEVKAKETIKDESAEKDEKLLDVQSGESETYQDNKQVEGSYISDTQQETVSVQDSSELVDKAKEEESYSLIEEEKHVPTTEEVPHAQQSLVEEKSDEVIQVLSALPSEESEGETIAESEKIKDIKGNEEEQVGDKIHTSLESFEVAETQSSLPLSSDEKEHEKIAEAKKTEDEEVTEAEPKGDISEKGLEIANKVDEETTMGLDSSFVSKTSENVCTNQEEYENLEAPKLEESKKVKSQEIPATTEATKSTNDQTLPIETIQSEQSTLSELVPRQGVEILEEEAKGAHKLQEEEIIPTETAQEEEKRKETIETAKATEAKSDQNLEEIHGEESKEPHKLPEEPRGLEFNDQDIADEGEESLVEKLVGVEEDGLDKTTNNQTLVGAESSKKIHKPSLESPCEISEETSKTVDEKIEEVTPDQESSYGSDTKESCLPREEERETKLPIEQIEKHEEEQVADKIHTSVGSFEITEPHSSLPSSSDEQKHVTVAETNKTEDKEVTEAEPMGYISEKGLEIASKVDEEITVDLDSSCASKTSKLVCTNQEASKVEESEEDKSQELSEATKAIKSTSDHSLTLKTIQAEQTRSSEIVSETDDQIPNKFVEIHEQETKNEDDQIPKKVEEIHEVETKEEPQMLQEEEIFPTETVLLQEEKGKEITENVEAMEATGDQIPKKVEETHEEETKEEPQMLREEEDILTKSVQKESVNEVLVSMLLASGEHEPVTPKENTNETPEEEHVSAETEPETEPRESGDFLSASSSLLSSEIDIQEPETKATKVQDETNQEEESKEDKSQEVLETKKAIKVREIHGDESISTEPKGDRTETKLTKVEDETSTEQGDESISTLPVVDILKGLQTTLESERAINDLKSPGESVTVEPTESEEKTSDVETESNEKVSAAEEIIEANMLQQNQREETKKIQEENGLSDIILPIEVLNLKEEEDKEDLKVQDSISREFVQVEEEEEAKEIAEKKQEESEAQQDASHETIKEEDQIDDIKEVKKSEDVQDEKLGGISAARENEEKLKSEVKKDQEDDESELREEAPKDHREEVIADKSLTIEAPVKQIHISSVELSNENVQVQDQSKDYEASVTDEDTYTQEKKSNDEKKNESEKFDGEAKKEIYEEESKQTETVTTSQEEEKETTEECFKTMKNIDDTKDKTQTEIQEKESLSSVGKTQDISKQEETKEPSSNETLKTIEEEAKESSRKSLSDLIEKVKGTSKSVEAETTETRIEEKTKTKEEEEEDKTSSDSLVMVEEAKDSTVSIIKTQPKKSQGILSGVGSKVKHSISKVKKVLTGKSSSHTTKPTSPK